MERLAKSRCKAGKANKGIACLREERKRVANRTGSGGACSCRNC